MREKIKMKWYFLYALVLCKLLVPCQYALAKSDQEKVASDITDGMNFFYTISLSVVQGVGGVFLAWGLLDFFTGWSDHQTSQQMQAMKKLGGGLGMLFIPGIIKIFI